MSHLTEQLKKDIHYKESLNRSEERRGGKEG